MTWCPFAGVSVGQLPGRSAPSPQYTCWELLPNALRRDYKFSFPPGFEKNPFPYVQVNTVCDPSFRLLPVREVKQGTLE